MYINKLITNNAITLTIFIIIIIAIICIYKSVKVCERFTTEIDLRKQILKMLQISNDRLVNLKSTYNMLNGVIILKISFKILKQNKYQQFEDDITTINNKIEDIINNDKFTTDFDAEINRNFSVQRAVTWMQIKIRNFADSFSCSLFIHFSLKLA